MRNPKLIGYITAATPIFDIVGSDCLTIIILHLSYVGLLMFYWGGEKNPEAYFSISHMHIADYPIFQETDGRLAKRLCAGQALPG